MLFSSVNKLWSRSQELSFIDFRISLEILAGVTYISGDGFMMHMMIVSKLEIFVVCKDSVNLISAFFLALKYPRFSNVGGYPPIVRAYLEVWLTLRASRP